MPEPTCGRRSKSSKTANADLAEQKTLVAQDVNALQLLVGAPIDPALLPESIDVAAPTIASLPAGLDSGILLRRPDVCRRNIRCKATMRRSARRARRCSRASR